MAGFTILRQVKAQAAKAAAEKKSGGQGPKSKSGKKGSGGLLGSKSKGGRRK